MKNNSLDFDSRTLRIELLWGMKKNLQSKKSQEVLAKNLQQKVLEVRSVLEKLDVKNRICSLVLEMKSLEEKKESSVEHSSVRLESVSKKGSLCGLFRKAKEMVRSYAMNGAVLAAKLGAAIGAVFGISIFVISIVTALKASTAAAGAMVALGGLCIGVTIVVLFALNLAITGAIVGAIMGLVDKDKNKAS